MRRKQGNFKGTIIYCKKVVTNQLISLSNKRFYCLVCFYSYWIQLRVTADWTEKKLIFGFYSDKNVNFQLIGNEFFIIQISKIMVSLEFSSFSALYVVKFGKVVETYTRERNVLTWWFLAGNQGYSQNFDLFLLTNKVWHVFMGLNS